MIDPDQKAKTMPESAIGIPRSQPMPRASLASPKPIQAPFDTNQKKAKGKAMSGPARNSHSPGMCGEKIKLLLSKKNKPANANTPKSKESVSGIILCRRSYTAITKRIENIKAQYIYVIAKAGRE